jgi:hypothetical protein
MKIKRMQDAGNMMRGLAFDGHLHFPLYGPARAVRSAHLNNENE